MEKILTLWYGSGLYNLTLGQAVMLVVGLLLLWLAIAKKFEPLLLVPIGFGGILANIPEAGLALSAAEQAATDDRAASTASVNATAMSEYRPLRFRAQTTPAPSGITRSAAAIAPPRAGSARAAIVISAFKVTI